LCYGDATTVGLGRPRQSAHAMPPLEQTGWRGCLKCMRISTLLCASFVLVAMATYDSVASDQQVESFSQIAATFLPQVEVPGTL
jgi:hypothetical protein